MLARRLFPTRDTSLLPLAMMRGFRSRQSPDQAQFWLVLPPQACQVTGFYLPDLCHIVRKPQKQPFTNLPISASQASGLTHRVVLVPACKSCMKYLAIGWPSLLAN